MTWGEPEEKRLAKIVKAIHEGMAKQQIPEAHGGQLLRDAEQIHKNVGANKVVKAKSDLDRLERYMKNRNYM